ncbi:hypothetical protein E2C01_029001 [Portunus trituberculatus]|uniref:Uncharacterized protein n=1 Tax=Portunus trituberculatus TaxID=210409 RepID=A0A5B7EQS8_PORTR|nr:hypothetical protein [Portunus trituberculatus]
MPRPAFHVFSFMRRQGQDASVDKLVPVGGKQAGGGGKAGRQAEGGLRRSWRVVQLAVHGIPVTGSGIIASVY